MKKIYVILFSLIISSCSDVALSIDKKNPEFEIISFDVVQKKLIIDTNLPDHVQNLSSKWFDQKVKIDGFDGSMIFTISNYTQKVSSISEGKRVDLYLSFNVLLDKPSQSQKKMIKGEVSSYGTLTGNFSLKEFDKVIKNSQTDLIIRLSRDLKSKI